MSRGADQSLNEKKRKPPRERWKRSLLHVYQRSTCWGQRHIPSGLRSALGILFLIGGVLGFLPLLGFWMIPLGLGLLALDFPSLRRRMEQWFGLEERVPQKHGAQKKHGAHRMQDTKDTPPEISTDN